MFTRDLIMDKATSASLPVHGNEYLNKKCLNINILTNKHLRK